MLDRFGAGQCRGGAHPPAIRDPGGCARRWDLLHAIGPALVAAFANSPPRAAGRPDWKSTRQAVWQALDPARTGVPPTRPGEDVPTALTTLGAGRSVDADPPRRPATWTRPARAELSEWLRQGRRRIPDRPPPTTDDLAYHLTTLFPQVRPRGHLEVRYVDAQPGRLVDVSRRP